MKQTLLPTNVSKYRAALLWRAIACIAVLIVTVFLNISLVIFRTDDNHKMHMLLNIVIDILAFSFLFSYIPTKLMTMSRLLRLALSNSENRISGTVISVGETEFVERFECIPVMLDSGRRIFLICDGNIRLSAGQSVTIKTEGHFATEVEHE